MRIHVSCWRLFYNEREFEDYERYGEWDATFDNFEDAIRYMDDKCGWSSASETFTFDVEVDE